MVFFDSQWKAGLEPIAEQHAGGMLLPPVQTLVATIIFARKGKNANRVLLFYGKKTTQRVVFFDSQWKVGLEPIAEQHAGGMLLPPVQTLVATIIFARKGKNESSPVVLREKDHPTGGLF